MQEGGRGGREEGREGGGEGTARQRVRSFLCAAWRERGWKGGGGRWGRREGGHLWFHLCGQLCASTGCKETRF